VESPRSDFGGAERAAATALRGLVALAVAGTALGLGGSRFGLGPALGTRLISLGLLVLCAAPLLSLLGLGLVVFRRDTRAAAFALAAVALTLAGILVAA
jgi:hypothetical protein